MVPFLESFIQAREPDKKLMMERLCLEPLGIGTHPARVRLCSGKLVALQQEIIKGTQQLNSWTGCAGEKGEEQECWRPELMAVSPTMSSFSAGCAQTASHCLCLATQNQCCCSHQPYQGAGHRPNASGIWEISLEKTEGKNAANILFFHCRRCCNWECKTSSPSRPSSLSMNRSDS